MKNKFISSIWEFDNSEKKHLIHNTFRWYGKLPQFLVRRLITMYSAKNDLVLANFGGSGTVLVESNIAGRDVIVNDMHPISILLNNVKAQAFAPDPENFINKIKSKKFPKKPYFDFKDASKWFYKESLIEIQGILEEIKKIKDVKERDFYLLCLSNIIRDGSKIDSRCVNHIVVDNKKKKIDVVKAFTKSVYDIKKAIDEFKQNKTNKKIKVIQGDAKNIPSVKDNSIDLVISHPPYASAVLYYNIYSLVSTILGYDYDSIRESDMSKGNFKQYIENLKLVLSENFRLLKRKKHMCMIIGDIRKDGDILTALPTVIAHGLSIGFQLRDIFIWKLVGKAGMNVARRGNHIDHNYLVVFLKP